MTTGDTTTGNRRGRSIALAAAGIALVIAACGAVAKPSGAEGTGGPLLAVAKCMRAHGVSNFPDPGANGPGLAIPNSIDTESPAFLSAQRACAQVGRPPANGSATGRSQAERLFALARCVRRHGVPNFPDPTRTPPPPGNGNAVGGGGAYLALGAGDNPRSPAIKQALAACGFGAP